MKKVTIKAVMVLTALSMLPVFSACTHVDPDREVAVRSLIFPIYIQIGKFELKHGIKRKPVGPGWTMNVPYVHALYVMDTTIRNLEMSEAGDTKYKIPGRPSKPSSQPEQLAAPAELSLEQKLDWVEDKLSKIDKRQYIVDHDRRRGNKSVWIKTSDGNDAWVDVVVQYKIQPEKAYLLIQNISMTSSDHNIEEDIKRLVESMVRSQIRFYLSALHTLEIAITEKRVKLVKLAEQDLNEKLGMFGIEIVSLYTPRVKLHRDYEMMIQLKQVVAEQKKEFTVQMETARQMIKKNESRAKGIADAMIEEATGRLEAARLKGEAELAAKELEAEALGFRIDQTARGIAEQTEELSASGGNAHVGLSIAEALQGKQIIIVPGEGSFNMLDINNLIQTYGAVKALTKPQTAPASGQETREAAPPEPATKKGKEPTATEFALPSMKDTPQERAVDKLHLTDQEKETLRRLRALGYVE